jgi:hypothetical protein
METAEVLSGWYLSSDPEVWRPSIGRDFSLLKIGWASVSPDYPPFAPDQAVARIVGETAVLDAIEADPNYVMMPGTREPYAP